MDNTYLSSDEPVLLTNHKIIIAGVRHEAVLTGKRILLTEESSGKVVEDIPFAALGMVTAGENALREPTLTLSFTTPTGETRSVGLIFSRQAGGLNIQERDKSLAFLRDHAVAVSGERREPGESTPSSPTAQDWMPTPFQNKVSLPAPAVPEGRSPFFTIAAIIVIIAVVIGVAIVYDPFGKGRAPPAIATVPTTTTALTPVATLTPLPTTGQAQPAETPAETLEAPAFSIPPTGVWVRVIYPGSFTGYVSAQGNTIQLNSTGDQLYPLTARDGMVDGSIEKQDLLADRLEVRVYQDGTLASVSNTTRPGGVLDFHVTLPKSTVSIGSVITPTPVVTAPELPLPEVPIPRTGVWLRVSYPGNFTGSFGPAGSLRSVNSTGDQFYQIPLSSGTIEGSIEKEDGSVETLVVVIYKDGAVVKRLETAVPLGVIYLNIPV